ncbi:hypothetical protein EV368DRAFT_78029 [Lentinula lateritia]|nr:hypothetical protein EV368DRAFT_78029 [Lentinula lateritia]
MAARRPLLNNLRQRPLTKVSSQYHAFSLSGIENVECLPMPRIADIFDAPTRLGSTNGHQFFFLHRASTAPPTSTMATRSSNAGRSSGGLPAPLLFEGPAHPRSSFSLLSTKPPRTVKSQSHPHGPLDFSGPPSPEIARRFRMSSLNEGYFQKAVFYPSDVFKGISPERIETYLSGDYIAIVLFNGGQKPDARILKLTPPSTTT